MKISRKEFGDLVVTITKEAVASLPGDLKSQAEQVLIVTADRPGPELTDQDDDDLLGLYEGIPLTERNLGGTVLPDTITIFRLPLLDQCRTKKELREEIRITLLHELGHFFGFGEEDMERLGLE